MDGGGTDRAATLVVAPGSFDVAYRANGGSIPQFKNPQGRVVPDLRAFARDLIAMAVEERLESIHLTKLTPVLDATRGENELLDVLLVGTRSVDPRWSPGDTGELAEFLAGFLPTCYEHIETRWMVVEGDVNDLGSMWAETKRVLDAVPQGPNTYVHLLASATPQLREATKLRFLLANDLGLIGGLTSWTVQDMGNNAQRDQAGKAIPEAALSLLSEAGMVRSLALLAAEFRFEAIETYLERWEVLDEPRRIRVKALALFGWRLMELDVRRALHVKGIPSPLSAGLDRAAFPLDGPNQHDRKALASLVPLAGLVLDAFAARWARKDVVSAVSLIHLLAEYGRHLACETTLGHAVDPVRLARQVEAPGVLWGFDDSCKHKGEQLALAKKLRPLNVARRDWKAFLGENFSDLGSLMVTCRGCSRVCGFADQMRSDPDLPARFGIVKALDKSELLKRRHQGPAGHFFMVPHQAEVVADWNSLAGRTGLRARDVGDLPLGLGELASRIAGQPVVPSGRIGRVALAIRAELEGHSLT